MYKVSFAYAKMSNVRKLGKRRNERVRYCAGDIVLLHFIMKPLIDQEAASQFHRI